MYLNNFYASISNKAYSLPYCLNIYSYTFATDMIQKIMQALNNRRFRINVSSVSDVWVVSHSSTIQMNNVVIALFMFYYLFPYLLCSRYWLGRGGVVVLIKWYNFWYRIFTFLCLKVLKISAYTLVHQFYQFWLFCVWYCSFGKRKKSYKNSVFTIYWLIEDACLHGAWRLLRMSLYWCTWVLL